MTPSAPQLRYVIAVMIGTTGALCPPGYTADPQVASKGFALLTGRFTAVDQRGPTFIRATRTDEVFPRMTESEIQSLIVRQKSRVEAGFGNDYSLQERLSAVEYNVRSKVGDTSKEVSAVTVSAKDGKWRVDHSISDRKTSSQLPRELEQNAFVNAFNLEYNRSRTYAWDGSAHRVIYNTEDRLSRNGQIFPEERNRGLADELRYLGCVPPSLMSRLDPNRLTAQVTKESPEAMEISLQDNAGPWRATITLSPQYGYGIVRITVDNGNGTEAWVEYSDYRVVDGVWYPFSQVQELTSRVGAESRVIKRRQWKVQEASFAAAFQDEEELFSPRMPNAASVDDYRFATRFSYRTDGDLEVAEDTIRAIDDTLSSRVGGSPSPPIATGTSRSTHSIADNKPRGDHSSLQRDAGIVGRPMVILLVVFGVIVASGLSLYLWRRGHARQ